VSRFPEAKLWLLALVLTHAVARAEVVVRVLETDPPVPAVLEKMEWVNVHLSYTSDEEVMFSPDSFFKGRRVSDENHFLGSGFRPAGSGEAAVAVAFVGSRKVDVVKIFAWGRSGSVIAETSFPVDLTWAGRAKTTIRQTPHWARSLKEQQSDLASKASEQERSWSGMDILAGVLMSLLMFAGVPAYLVLQAITVRRLRGGWLKQAVAVGPAPYESMLKRAAMSVGGDHNILGQPE
jgi:hypothetical protein